MRLLAALLVSTSISFNAAAFETKAKQAIITDAATQSVLFSKHADAKMFPSSMSKLMTLYILFDKLKSGAITLNTRFPVSEKAWKKGGSKMFVRVNTQVRVEDLIRGIIVQSGNDACIVVAEALAGSEEAFAKQMTAKAKAIGLKASHFANATGWPHEQHYMTAHDLARLSDRLVKDFPDYYHYFNEASYTYSGITQSNRNRLIGKGVGVDGLKTGHTEIAGYGIAISGVKPNTHRRVHVVVNGLSSDAERISEARRLIEFGYREFELASLAPPSKTLALLPVWMGAQDSIKLGVAAPLAIAAPLNKSAMRFEMQALAPVQAPIAAGTALAVLHIYNAETLMKTVPLVAQEDVAQAGFMRSFIKKLHLMMKD